MKTNEATNSQLNEINDYLESQGIDDFEHQCGNLVVDGFESKGDADDCETAINEILDK